MFATDDPVLRALREAPVEDETPEERALLLAAQEQGGWIPAAQVSAELAARADEDGWAAAGK